MKQSKYIYLTIIILIVIFIASSIVVVKNRHQDRLYTVVEKEILEAANKCKLDNICAEEITLKMLYDNNYLTEQVNPITKKKYSNNLEIDVNSSTIEWIKS